MDLKETYNRIAEDWHKDHQNDDWWLEGTNTFIKLLPSGASVLDVGCGSGVKSRYLQDNGLNVTGIDLSENMIAIAKRESPDIDFQVLDFKDVGLLDQTFGGIFMQAALLHVPKADAQARIHTLQEKLQPGGLFYIAVKAKREGGADEEVKAENDYGYVYERFFSYYTIDELRGYLKSEGMDVEYQDHVNTHWIQIIGRKPGLS